MECLSNKLTPFNSKIHYKEENYLKVKTVLFEYITPPYSKGSVCWYIIISVRCVFIFPHSHILSFAVCLSYPLSCGFTGSSFPASFGSCTLSLSCTNSFLSICTN